MDLVCQNCGKHKFKIWQFTFPGYTRLVNPIHCPKCGAGFTLEPRVEKVINRVIIGALVAIAALDIAIDPHIPTGWQKPGLGAIVGFTVVGVSSWIATICFGKIIPARPKPPLE